MKCTGNHRDSEISCSNSLMDSAHFICEAGDAGLMLPQIHFLFCFCSQKASLEKFVKL